MDYTIEGILKISDSGMINFLKKKFNNYISHKQDFVYINNKSDVTLVAHIDTVRWDNKKPVQPVFKGDCIYNANGILGADDRAGVFGLLFIYDYLKAEGKKVPNLLFTTGEESGNIGANAFCDTCKKLIDKTKVFIELDRAGKNDFVTYDYEPDKNSKRFFTSFGFKHAIGSFSDISAIIENYKKPCVNLSIGYYNQHSNKEYLNISEMFATIFRVINILKGGVPKLDGEYIDPYSFMLDKEYLNYSNKVNPYKGGKTYGSYLGAYCAEERDYDRKYKYVYENRCPICDYKLSTINDCYYCSGCGNAFDKNMDKFVDMVKTPSVKKTK